MSENVVANPQKQFHVSVRLVEAKKFDFGLERDRVQELRDFFVLHEGADRRSLVSAQVVVIDFILCDFGLEDCELSRCVSFGFEGHRVVVAEREANVWGMLECVDEAFED